MNTALITKAAAIQLLILDVDGVLTDGRLYYSAEGEAFKAFHVHDGAGIKRLQSHGVIVAVITARHSAAVASRMHELGVQHVYQGQTDKTVAFADLCQKLQVPTDAIAYVGDDLADLPVMQKVGLSIAVANAVAAVKKQADYLTEARGGEGAVREVCDLIINAQTHA